MTENPLQSALDAAYRYLSRRDRTEAEVRQRLEQVGTANGVLDEAIAILIDQHVLDDERYARLFVEDKRRLEQWGADRIRRTLAGRGIDRELIEQALSAEDPEDGGGELERAVELLRSPLSKPAAGPKRTRSRARNDAAQGV